MIETIQYKNNFYPKFQSEGHASQFAIPFAKHLCKGKGYDIGCMRKEWAFPGSVPIDISFGDGYHANNLPEIGVDYIFSSHCLEHIPNWVDTMDYWYSVLKPSGVLFLYLPDYSQVYWRPWNNRKHINIFSPTIIKDYMEDKKYNNIYCSQVDLNNSFMIFGEK
jgi:SAM-dependent methyltransferase